MTRLIDRVSRRFGWRYGRIPTTSVIGRRLYMYQRTR